MILVNIRASGATAVTPEQIAKAAARAWVVSDASLDRFGDVLLAVRHNVVVGAWTIDGYERITEGVDEGKIRFSLSPAPEFAEMVGEESPTRWTQGQANPVKLVETETMRPESSEVELTPQGNKRVKLDGWSLIVYPDGRARISPAKDDGRKLIVESAFPGPNGGNVTVRTIDA